MHMSAVRKRGFKIFKITNFSEVIVTAYKSWGLLELKLIAKKKISPLPVAQL